MCSFLTVPHTTINIDLLIWFACEGQRVFFVEYSFFSVLVCKDPPYKVEESGYAGFILPIEVYFKNKVWNLMFFIRKKNHVEVRFFF